MSQSKNRASAGQLRFTCKETPPRCSIGAVLLTLISLSSFGALPASAQRVTARPLFRNNMHQLSSGQSSLQGFSAPRAAPIQSSSSSGVLAPSALFAPDYCDIETLRSSATIRSIRFLNNRQGVVVGDHGFIAVTLDGGITWDQKRSGVECRLDDAIWIDARRVIASGGGYDVVTQLSRGVVVTSRDGGQTWRRGSDSDMPRLWKLQTNDSPLTAASNRDVTLLASGELDPVTGAHQFESADDGRTWQPLMNSSAMHHGKVNAGTVNPGTTAEMIANAPPTNVNAAQAAMWSKVTGARATIHASCRLSDQTVLAVGDHGLILRSSDQGTTWHSVHPSENPRKDPQGQPPMPATAVLFIASRLDRIPWALIGRESLEERLRTCVFIQQRIAGVPKAAAQGAAMRLGAASLETCTEIDSTKELCRWLETHRPPILAIDGTMDAATKSTLLQKAVSLGTTKVIEFGFEDRGESTLHDDAMLPSTGVLAGDFQTDARLAVTARMARDNADVNRWTTIDVRYDAGRGSRRSQLADGVRLSAEHRLPPRVRKASRRRLQVIQGRLKQNELLADLLQSEDNPDSLADSLSRLLTQTSQTDRFRLAWTLASESRTQTTQTASWGLLFKQFPGSSACQLAKLHQDARATSVEWQHVRNGDLKPLDQHANRPSSNLDVSNRNLRSSNQSNVRLASGETLRELTPQGNAHSTIVSPFQIPSQSGAVVQAGAQFPPAVSPMPQPNPGFVNSSPTSLTASTQGMTESPATASAIDLAWQVHPLRLIVTDAIERARADEQDAWLSNQSDAGETVAQTGYATERNFDLNAKTDAPAASQDGLSADLRRTANRNTPWSPLLRTHSPQVIQATRTEHPPRLDGVLDEVWWKQNAPLNRASVSSSTRAIVSVGYDERFVYLALKTPLADLPNRPFDETEIGKRDAALRSANRIRIQLDLDRDLLTGFELQFTRDGRTRDTIDGDTRWNPTWYVSAKEDRRENPDSIITEIAIEQASLGQPIRPGDQWFINLDAFETGQIAEQRWMPNPATRVRVDF